MATRIELNNGFNFSSTTIDALTEAARLNIVIDEKNGKKVYWSGGNKFTTPKALGEHLIEMCNTWMIDCGLVDLDIIKRANRCGYSKFRIYEA